VEALRARQRGAGDDDPPALGQPVAAALGQRPERAVEAAAGDQRPAQLVLAPGLDRQPVDLVDPLGHVESLEADRASRLESRRDLLAREQQALDRHPQPLALGGVVVGAGLLEDVLEPREAVLGILDQHQGIVGQVVEEALLIGLQQRCQRLGAGRHVAAQQRVDQRVDLTGRNRLGLRLGPDRRRALDHLVAVEEQLAGGRQQRRGHLVLGSLAGRVEAADRVDLVAPQLDAQRRGELGREDVDDVAPHRDLARLLDERHALVADPDEAGDEAVAVERLAHRDASRRGPQSPPRGHAQGEGRARRDHDRRGLIAGRRRPGVAARFAIGDAIEEMQHLHALAQQEGLGREAVEGQGVVAREGAQPRPIGALSEQLPERAQCRVRGAGVGRHVEHRALAVGADQVARGHPVRGAAQPGDAPQGALRPHLLDRPVEGRLASSRRSTASGCGTARSRLRTHPGLMLSAASAPQTRKARHPRQSGGRAAGA
jgi:hypothetical protein